MLRHIKTTRPCYKANVEAIDGGTIRAICDSLPKTQADYDMYDCVIVVVNMNQAKGGKVWRDDSDQGVELMRRASPCAAISGRWSSSAATASSGTCRRPRPKSGTTACPR